MRAIDEGEARRDAMIAAMKPTWLEKLRGKRTGDIELPPEHARDPRLPPSLKESLERAQAGYRVLRQRGLAK